VTPRSGLTARNTPISQDLGSRELQIRIVLEGKYIDSRIQRSPRRYSRHRVWDQNRIHLHLLLQRQIPQTLPTGLSTFDLNHRVSLRVIPKSWPSTRLSSFGSKIWSDISDISIGTNPDLKVNSEFGSCGKCLAVQQRSRIQDMAPTNQPRQIVEY